MTDSSLHFAMRETQSLLSRRGVWVAMLAVGVVLGISGPFGTVDEMRLLPRLAYWMVVAVVTFSSGVWVSAVVERALARWVLPRWLKVSALGTAIGTVVAIEVLVLNWGVFGLPPDVQNYALPLLANAIGIAIVVSLALNMIETTKPHATPERTPPLLGRLPFDKRGSLVALSVSDHYVEVRTTKGQELLLMRLSDAMRETGSSEGLQVHRSHWVALDAIKAARRDGAKAVLTLTDNHEIPVSRTYLGAVKEAGLLPE